MYLHFIALLFLASACNFKFVRRGLYSTSSRAEGVAVGDFNQDARLDLAVIDFDANKVDVFLGYGNGTFASQMTFATGSGSITATIALGDFNQDNLTDMAVTNFGTNNVGVFLGYGNGTFAPQTTFSTGAYSQPYGVAVGDFNQDTILDIAVANFGTNNVGIFFGYGNGTFAPQTMFSTGIDSGPAVIAVGDFNQDTRLDIVVAAVITDNVGILLGYGNGTFAPQTTFSTGNGSYPFGVVVGDFNQDTMLDIGVANYHAKNVGILLGYGDGTFAPQTTFSTGNGSMPDGIIVADFNQDTRLDIAVNNYGTNNVGVFLGYGDGTFAPQTTFSTGSGSAPTSVAVGDFNQDSRLDIAVANYNTNNVMIFLNMC